MVKDLLQLNPQAAIEIEVLNVRDDDGEDDLPMLEIEDHKWRSEVHENN